MVTRTNASFDPVKDFAPIALATSSPNIVVVNASLGVKSIRDLIALAKARPGELNYGRAGAGGSSHLSAELFKSMAAVNIVSVPYKGSGPALIGLLGGQVQLIFATAPTVAPHVKSGKLSALAVTTAQPSALFPGLTTVTASGVPGYDSATIYGFLAPAKTPDAVIKRLNQDLARMLSGADMKEKLLNAGVEPVGGSPGEFASKIKSEMTLLGKLIKDAGISAE
jgi:tripartite-type tricarboxylate transporter receptor subunit TctC